MANNDDRALELEEEDDQSTDKPIRTFGCK